MSEQEPLQTADEVIDALGGTTAVARLTKSSVQVVSNWRGTGRLAPRTFLVISTELERHGKRADPRLWGIQQPEAESAA